MYDLLGLGVVKPNDTIFQTCVCPAYSSAETLYSSVPCIPKIPCCFSPFSDISIKNLATEVLFLILDVDSYPDQLHYSQSVGRARSLLLTGIHIYVCMYVYTHTHTYIYMLAQSCPSLCDPMASSPPSSSVHGISQARILERVTISSSRGSSPPKDQTYISCIGRQIVSC